MTRESVEGGYCNWPDTVGCALTKSECDDPANFLSSRQMQGWVSAHGGSCRWQDAVRSIVLGRCKTGGVETSCASDIEACPDGTEEWNGPDPECTVETTSFGRCDYGMCAWSHEHCHEDNTWEAFDEGCSCEHVQVGACSRWNDNEREVFCAVSELACDEEQSWISPQEVKTAAGFDCFLCRETSVDVPNDPDLSASSDSAALTENVSSKQFSGNKSIIISSSVVGCVIAFSIIGLVVWKVFKSKRTVKRALDGLGTEQPPSTLSIEVNMENSKDMTDNGSVLSDE